MQKSILKKSTETIYEIKASLATFDTIDLDDLDRNHAYSPHSLKAHSLEKGVAEQSETIKDESFQVQKDLKEEKKTGNTLLDTGQNDEPFVQTLTETNPDISDKSLIYEQNTSYQISEPLDRKLDATKDYVEYYKSDSNNDNESNDMTESGNITPTEACIGSKDANSSENNASAEEIQNQLKQKGRKQKEKASSVKYQQIDSFSDVSDQEKESPLPSLKIQSQTKHCDSDSESSDSDSGYFRKGFVTPNKGWINKDAKSPISNKNYNLIGDFVDSDTTPYSSPKPRRPAVPPPLSKEESAIISKRKAYEKRIKRLQVTTNPIERPRSTTPINIYGLDEYVYISSPEKSPRITGNLAKLKITLPADEGSKGKSPRRGSKYSRQRSSESPEANFFSFNEDLLFTHTKSAILLEDDNSKGFSPKRVLVPPTLSPYVSPRNIPSKTTDDISPAKYMVDPWESDKQDPYHDNIDLEKWAVFDTVKETTSEKNVEDNILCSNNPSSLKKSENSVREPSSIHTYCIDSKSFPDEEILTVHIDEAGDSRKCDISFEPIDFKDICKFDDTIPNVDEQKDSGKCETDIKLECSKQSDNVVIETEEDLGTPV